MEEEPVERPRKEKEAMQGGKLAEAHLRSLG